ncbi:hypothetical protein NQ314_016084, partial [Rhamnusium bicolor]
HIQNGQARKNIMLSSFFWGYICFQIGAGQLAKNYGPKLFLGGTTCIGSIFCLLIPVFGSVFGYGGVIACRVITGMSQGFIFPCVHNLLSAWAPTQDRAKISTFAYADILVRTPTPWKAIFTSLPFWAILVAHCGQNWGFWTLFTEIPSYMQNILNFNIASYIVGTALSRTLVTKSCTEPDSGLLNS